MGGLWGGKEGCRCAGEVLRPTRLGSTCSIRGGRREKSYNGENSKTVQTGGKQRSLNVEDKVGDGSRSRKGREHLGGERQNLPAARGGRRRRRKVPGPSEKVIDWKKTKRTRSGAEIRSEVDRPWQIRLLFKGGFREYEIGP